MSDETNDQLHLKTLQQFPLKGHCLGRFALSAFNASELQALLPPDLELAPQSYTPEGQHPLLFMFDNTWLHINPLLEQVKTNSEIEPDLHYYEFIAMLPFVQFKNNENGQHRGPYCFLPVLYLNSQVAVFGGRVFWLFNKIYSDFTVSREDGFFSVTDHDVKASILSGETTLKGIKVPGGSINNFNKILPILKLPVIEYGHYIYVSSRYEINLNNVDITPAEMSLKNFQSEYFPIGHCNIPSILDYELGAFNIDYHWKLSYIQFVKI